MLTLSAEKLAADAVSIVEFNPPTAFSHAALKHAWKVGSEWGLVYAAFGNAGDTQPFHGWLFEIDMDAWKLRDAKQAISNMLLTTAEAECPVTIESGTQEMICGGGIWTPAGPQLYPTQDSYELIVPVGNGIRVKDGAVIFEQSLLGTSRQLSAPLIEGNTIYLASTFASTGKAMVEAYRIEEQAQ